MKIVKIINNNVVNTCDEEGREIIVTGRDVGSKTEKGSAIDEEKMKEIFHLEGQDIMDKFRELLVNLPMEYVQILAETTSYTKEVLNQPTNPNVYIILTDYINLILERYEQRMTFSNLLIREVCSFYHAEYLIGEYAIAMIERSLGVKLPVDETASIALHTVNAEYDAPMGDAIKITSLIQRVLEAVRECLSIELDEQSLSYERSITHLRFLTQRVFTGEHTNLDNLELQEIVDRLYPGEYACGQKIQALIRLQYRHRVAEEGVAYLALHIKRIRTKQLF